MEDTPIQWHPGFVAAMNLELAQYRNILRFEKEYNLNVKPLEIDLLIIKKDAGTRIENEIGRIFQGHNMIEYKNPADHLNIDVFYKVEGYACLYKSYGETVDAVKADDITMTLVRETKPKGLFRYFEEHGYQVSNPYAGIYYVRGNTLFPAQIVVTKELDSEAHIWLKALSEKLEKHDIRKLLVHIRQLKGKFDIELADAVLEVSMLANERIVEELMGDDSMSEAFLEMMKPIIEPLIVKREKECTERALQKGMEQGIQGTVSVLRRLEVNEGQIMKSIMEQYSLTEEEAKRYTQQ